jgi:hypothetical protein
MATFANFGLFDSSMEERRRANAMRQANSRQMGQDIGTITGSFLQNYNENKRKEVLKNINDAWDYEHESDIEDLEYDAAMASGPNEEIDTKFGTIFDGEKMEDVPNVELKRLAGGKVKALDPRTDMDEQLMDQLQTDVMFDESAEVDPRNLIQRRADLVKANTEGFDVSDQIAQIDKEIAGIELEGDIELDEFEEPGPITINKGMVKGEKPTLFQSPEEEAQYKKMRGVFAKGMTDEQKYRRSAALLAPYDPRGAREMIEYADSRAKLERQLGEKERISRAQSKSKEPITNITKTNTFIQQRQRSNEQLRTRIDGTDINQTELRTRLEGEINKNNDEIKFAKTQLAKYAKDMPLEDLYTFEGDSKTPKGLNVDANEPDSKVDPNRPKGLKEDAVSLESVIGNETNKALQDAAIQNALRDKKITKTRAEQLQSDLQTQRKASAQDAAPVKSARDAWDKLTDSSTFIKTEQEFNKVKNARDELLEAVNDPNLTVARAKQLAFKIARVVTGPGTLTESEVLGTQNRSLVEASLEKVGLEWLLTGSDRSIENTVKGMRAALEGTSGYNTAIDNYNDRVQKYNTRYGKVNKKPLKSRLGGTKKELTQAQKRELVKKRLGSIK